MYATQVEECASRCARAQLFPLIATVLLLSANGSAFAGSATWSTSPANGNWNNAQNWSPVTVPNSSADTATFGSSSVINISLSDNTEVDGMVFNPGASPFIISAGVGTPDEAQFLTINGVGITNNAGVIQNFVP